jgi:hypothetical protein
MFIVTCASKRSFGEIESLFDTFNIFIEQIKQISENEYVVIPVPRERCAGYLEFHFQKHGACFYSKPFSCTIDNYHTSLITP